MIYIKDFIEKDKIEGVYFVETAEVRLTSGKDEYLRVNIKDKTGKIIGNAWDISLASIKKVDAGDYAFVTGEVYNYNGQLQLKIYGIRKAKEEEYNIKDYLEVSKYDIDNMKEELNNLINSIDNKFLKELLIKIFYENKEFIERFSKHPAAKTIHHNFVGGLIEHTLGVARLSDKICELYEEANRDLLITGALLHDIGKIHEMSEYPLIEYTSEGLFLGHILIGIKIISEKTREIEGFPKELELELEHLILSHHGEFEFGSPKKPALIEAFILNHADNIDAKMEIFRKELKDIAPDKWTKNIFALDSPIRKTIVSEK